jgi:transcriptional regulator with XRE-family HTH domain
MKINPVRLEILKRYGSQELFAIASGLNETVLSKILRGVRQPTPKQAQVFERLLEVSADQLFGEEHGTQQAR